MPRSTTQEEYLSKAICKFNNKFDYSKTIYIHKRIKIIVICPIHGEFECFPLIHLSSQYGCKQCAAENSFNRIRNTEDYVIKAISLFKDLYDYSLINYINNITPITIICKKHGKFDAIPTRFLQGQKCPICAKEEIIEQRLREFITNSNIKHNNKYDYSLVKYVNSRTPVIVICPNCGPFKTKPQGHAFGKGCPTCAASKGEAKIIFYLKNKNILFKKEKSFKNCKNPKTNGNLRFDFYLPSYNLCIEYDGSLHYIPYKDTEESIKILKEVQERDLVKTEYCNNNNIRLIRIPYWDFDNIESILDKELK